MKKLVLLFAVYMTSLVTVSAQRHSCCAPSTDGPALALQSDFIADHLAPNPLDYTPEATSSMLQFTTTSGNNGTAFYVPSGKPTKKVLILCHEWWGLNDYIKREAEHWQKMLGDVDVYAIDLYDGKVASTPDDASKYMSALDQARGEAIVKGLLQKIGNDKEIVTLGWCMGGTWSFNTTLAAGNHAKGCVMYYGFPESDVKRIKTLKTDILYIYGSQDKYITKDAVETLGKEVKAAGHKFELHAYDAVHAFANPSNPKFDKVHADEAEAISLKFIKSKLGLK
ncbi:MAG: dienelactone hydrolase family protein [Bacteroidota bacterium]